MQQFGGIVRLVKVFMRLNESAELSKISRETA